MIRSILNGHRNGAPKAARYMSTQLNSLLSGQNRPKREQLFVRLCGRIDECPDQMHNGSLIVPLTTNHVHDGFHAKHRVFVPPSILKNHSASQIVEGKRVYITGFIGYKEIRNEEGYTLKTAQINANKILLCAENEDVASDVNDVKLYGYVVSKPHIIENTTLLDVATEVYDPREQRHKNNVHQLAIMEDDEIQLRASCLDIGAGVYIHGHLKTECAHKQNAILRLTYQIRPTKLIVCQPTTDNFEFEEY